ncbi:Pentatricopeptide repeat-containing protein, chloroplastic [Symbiodinium microadriaticum]|uniref:Pentatricopeptide repeat-containing protein, chloroplastic n=1 Tax=Symbiodinium microadriaticum TaxID=2951 RepID=A0A1Q9EH77_SYMMI|nr:Pentatricopeptide repeat-containing protein, chloroplastic [Symbiodinium microadriaticum]
MPSGIPCGRTAIGHSFAWLRHLHLRYPQISVYVARHEKTAAMRWAADFLYPDHPGQWDSPCVPRRCSLHRYRTSEQNALAVDPGTDSFLVSATLHFRQKASFAKHALVQVLRLAVEGSKIYSGKPSPEVARWRAHMGLRHRPGRRTLAKTANTLAAAIGERDGLKEALNSCARDTGIERANLSSEIKELSEDLTAERAKNLGLEVAKPGNGFLLRRVSLQPGRAEQRCLDLVRMVVLVIWFYDDGPMNLVTVVVAIVVVLVVMMVLMAVMVRTTMILLMGEEAGRWSFAFELISRLASLLIRGTATTLNTAISAAEKGLQWPWSLQLFEHRESQEDAVTFNATVAAFEKSGEWRKALHLLDEMQDARIRSDVVAFNSAISASEKGGRWQVALWLLQRLEESSLRATLVTYNAAISACEKQKQVHQALLLLEELQAGRLQLDVISFGAAISACEKAGEWEQALHLLATMSGHRLQGNVITFSAAISACEARGQWQQALHLFADFQGSSLPPNVITCCAVISACEKGLQWQRALQLLTSMREEKLQCTVVAFNAAISACEKEGSWQHALLLLRDLRSHDIAGNTVTPLAQNE